MTTLPLHPGRHRPRSGAARTVAVSATALVKTYGRGDAAVDALAGVDVAIPANRFTAIMGPSGSGKSTLMHLLAGLDVPTSGSVVLGDTELYPPRLLRRRSIPRLTRCSDRELTAVRRDRVGFVFQAFNLLPQLTAQQNIELPARLAGRTIDPERQDLLLGLLGLRDRLHHRPTELSGGQQQRVALARALLGRPDVVFADEPTGNLDSVSGREVLELLHRSVHELGQTVVMVTHDPVAASYADAVLLMRDGLLAGTVADPRPDAIQAAIAELSR